MSSFKTLSNENALALRLLRTQSVPLDFWLWLSGLSSTPLDGIASWIDPNVLKSIKEIIEPNLVDANAQERIQSKETDAWIAAILGFANRRAAALKLHCGPMMAVSLLPLYRNLATRKLPEAIQETRSRLAEMLILIGIAQELGDDFAQLLQHRGAPAASPYTILNSALKVDLVAAGMLSRQLAHTFETGSGEFDRSAADPTVSTEHAPPRANLTWSDPQLLWQIASELMTKKAEIVLPRQWADVAVPWTNICEHWHALTHRLTLSTAVGKHEHDDPIENNVDDEIVSEMIDDLLAMQADVIELSVDSSSEGASTDSVDANNAADNSRGTGRAHSSLSSSIGSPRIDSNNVESETDPEEEYPETDILEPQLEPSVSKIAIIEINSYTDTMFVNIMRRQINTARSLDNSICLVALYVESEDVADRERIGTKSTNGLLIWQDKLVNWLADHPQVHAPFAFVTGEGQLVFSMQDIERTVATNLVREGLVTVLTGKCAEDRSALAQVVIPARYYAGIGSACPNAGFAAEQLIEATWRCLSAAQNQGKATIKSIEVF